MPAQQNPQQLAQESLGQEAKETPSVPVSSETSTVDSTSTPASPGSTDPEEDTGRIQPVEEASESPDPQLAAAYAQMRGNVRGGSGAQPGV